MAEDTIPRPGDNTNNLLWKILQALNGGSSGGGGSGGAVTIADGANVAQGSTSDSPETNPLLSATEISILKGVLQDLNSLNTSTGGILSPAETNPASGAPIISLLKGILTAVNVPSSGGTSNTTINNSLTDIDNNIDTTNTELNTVNTNLTTVNTKLDTLSATIGQQRGALTNRSGSITTGGTSQQVAAGLATRKYFFFQNISSETMWINFTSAAVADQPSISILPNGVFIMEGFFVSTEAINVISATTGSKFVSKEA